MYVFACFSTFTENSGFSAFFFPALKIKFSFSVCLKKKILLLTQKQYLDIVSVHYSQTCFKCLNFFSPDCKDNLFIVVRYVTTLVVDEIKNCHL